MNDEGSRSTRLNNESSARKSMTDEKNRKDELELCVK